MNEWSRRGLQDNGILYRRGDCTKVQGQCQMGMDLYTTAQGSEGAHPPVQLLQQEAYRRSLCQVRGGFRPHGVVHARRYPGEIRHDPASTSVRTSTVTTSHRRRSTGRSTTRSYTSTFRRTPRKRARPNTTP